MKFKVELEFHRCLDSIVKMWLCAVTCEALMTKATKPAKGNYVPGFYQQALNDQALISNIERHLNKLCERARQLDDYAGNEGEMSDIDVVSRLHR